MNRFKKWPILDRCREQGALVFIDLAFADALAKSEDDAALLAFLFAFSRQGHLALDLSRDALIFALQAQGVKDAEAVAGMIHRSVVTFVHPSVCSFGTLYYLQKNWTYETQILKHLDRLHKNPPIVPLESALTNPKLNPAQKEAVENAMLHSLSLLTGGPGTGKTYTAAEFVKTSLTSLSPEKRKLFRIILTAPTGKAVAQLEGNLRTSLEESISIQTGTLHAILGIKNHESEEDESEMLFADLIIVDECSMIDARIFSRLLASVPNGARLLLIGDKNQLPPIEAGSIFADLIDAGVYPSVHLNECLRSDLTEILTLAEHIKQGDAQAALQHLKNHKSIAWADLNENKITHAQLWEQCQGHFKPYAWEKPVPEQILSLIGRFSLLSSIRKGPLGVEAINRYFLYQSIKAVPEDAWWIAPIMITRNDYALELYNGDLGFLVRKCPHDFSLRQLSLEDYVLFRGRKGGYRQLSALHLSSYEYCFCLSVHKSQGSEYDESLILIPPGSELFGREAIYTAITRVKRKVSLLCSAEVLTQSILTSSKKMSGLILRIKCGLTSDKSSGNHL